MPRMCSRGVLIRMLAPAAVVALGSGGDAAAHLFVVARPDQHPIARMRCVDRFLDRAVLARNAVVFAHEQHVMFCSLRGRAVRHRCGQHENDEQQATAHPPCLPAWAPNRKEHCDPPFPPCRLARTLLLASLRRRSRLRPGLTARRPYDRRADAGTRTPDPFITSEVLYQLSYVGAPGDASEASCARTPSARSSVQQRLAVLLAEARPDAADLQQRLRARGRAAQQVFEHGVGGDGVGRLALGARVAPRAQALEVLLVDRRPGRLGRLAPSLSRRPRRRRARREALIGALAAATSAASGSQTSQQRPLGRPGSSSPKWSRIWRRRQVSPLVM